MDNLQYKTTGSVTTVKTNGGALIGYLIERFDGNWSTIAGPGHGTGATYTSQHRALQHLIAGTSPNRNESQIEAI
jgi:hypothetical protein